MPQLCRMAVEAAAATPSWREPIATRSSSSAVRCQVVAARRQRVEAVSAGAAFLVEAFGQLMPSVDIQAQSVVAAPEVLHERVPGTDHLCRAQPFHTRQQPQPGFQKSMIGFAGICV